MLTLGRQAQASAVVVACIASIGAVIWVERLSQASEDAAILWLWLGLAVCTAFAFPVFGEHHDHQRDSGDSRAGHNVLRRTK
jgi:FtsH-binding integral membrane protein